MRPLVIYSYILQHFSIAWKIALYNLVFHQLPLIQHCSIFYKKMSFRVPKILGEFKLQNMFRMASECISYNLEFQNFSGEDPPPTREGKPPLGLSGTRLSPYFNSFWEPCLREMNLGLVIITLFRTCKFQKYI
jgi:hypothetical protein